MNAKRIACGASRPSRILLFSTLIATLLLSLLAGIAPRTAQASIADALLLRSALNSRTQVSAQATARANTYRLGYRNLPNGRTAINPALLDSRDTRRSGALRRANAVGTANTVPIPNATQTFDINNPPPAFEPLVGYGVLTNINNDSGNAALFINNLTPTNLTPVWSADQTFIVFSSNRTIDGGVQRDGRFHIWAMSASGGEAYQVTGDSLPGGQGEFFPALSANNTKLAFVSDAQTPGIRNLFVLGASVLNGPAGGGFSYNLLVARNNGQPPATGSPYIVNVSQTPTDDPSLGISSVTIRGTDPLGFPATGFTQVQRPTFSPGNDGLLCFSAFSVTGNNQNHFHLYFLNTNSLGFDTNNNISFPGKLTDGPADDTDPAWSQDGQFIAFASTASTVATKTSNNSFGPNNPSDEQDPNQSQSQTTAANGTTLGSLRSLFLISGGSNGTSSGFGSVPTTVAGGRITAAGTDNFGPAWSYATLQFRNQYTNPAPGFEYLAFARGTSQNTPHDIYYLQTVRSTDGGSESDRSNEAGSTPVPVNSPVYQVNAGDVNAGEVFGNYAADNSRLFNGGTGLFTGGTANNAPANTNFNLTNDPGTPAGIYQTNRQGTFSYTLPNLTPAATYTVRLHFAEVIPGDQATGKRVFSVTANGQPVPALTRFDISQQAGAANGNLAGQVTTGGNPVTGATVTITQGNQTTTVTTVAPTSPPGPSGDGAPQNYAASLASGPATITVTAPGLGTQVQTVNITANGFVRANFALAANSATVTGTVSDTNGGLGQVPVVVTDPANFDAIVAGPVNTDGNGRYTLAVPAGTYNITALGAVGNDAVQSQSVTFTAGQTTTTNFALATVTSIGTVGGLVTDGLGNPLTGATVTVRGPNGYFAVVRTTAVSSPGPPNGNNTPQNFVLSLPGATPPGTATPVPYRFTPALPGYGPSPNNNASVVNGTFVQDAVLVLPATSGGANAFPAVVRSFTVQPDANGIITLNFLPVAGDPPIVEGVEVLANPVATLSSGFGGATPTNGASTAPQSLTAVGGDGRVTLRFSPAVSQAGPNATAPTFYRIFRSPASLTAVNSPGGGAGQEGVIPYMDGITPTIDPANPRRLIFVDTGVTNGNEYFYQVTALFQQFITPEGDTAATGTANAVVKLNTDDNTTATLGGTYDDVYPTWSPFASVFSIAYQTGNFVNNTLTTGRYALSQNGTPAPGTILGGRTVTYNNPADTTPTEVAISIPNGATAATSDPNNAAYTVAGTYTGIFQSQVLNLDPPTLLRYAPDQVIHVQASGAVDANGQALNPINGSSNKLAVVGSQNITFTLRLSNREAGIDNTGGPTLGTGNLDATAANNPKVFLQIKDPDSKYQDDPAGNGLEHKVFSRDRFFNGQSNQAALNEVNGGTANQSLGLGFGGYEFGPNVANGGPYDYPSYTTPGGVTYVGNRFQAPRGPHGGRWAVNAAHNPRNTYIYVGKGGGGTNPYINPIQPGFPGSGPINAGGDPALFIPTGPEYECQLINPQFALTPGGSTTNASPNDYRSPYYLAGIDDQQAFSGAANPPRPTANVQGAGGVNQPAEYLQMIKSPIQDNKGGVLYTVTWKTPSKVSDFYLDVIAYDKAVFPVLPPGTSQYEGGQFNWRIYDNVGGFSTQRTLPNNDILFVSDYALGQKFAATTFGGQNVNANLLPKQFGTESYLTDVDINILPDRVYAGIPTDATSYIFNPALNPFLNSPEGSQRTPGRNNSPAAVRSQNGLGVGSYFDNVIDGTDQLRLNGIPNVNSQKYTIWRILSRGPVPDTLLQSYQPTPVSQPVVSDAPNASAPAKIILDAHRCVVWLSPYTGSLLIDPGTLDDLDLTGVPNVVNRVRTQTALRNFVSNGGRLFVTGQDVGVTLTQRGTASLNTAGAFLPDVLNAAYASDGGGSTTLTATDNRIFGNPLFDGTIGGTNGSLTYLTMVGDIVGGFGIQNVTNFVNEGDRPFPYKNAALFLSSASRNDGAFSQIPPVQLPGGASIQGQRDTITPLNGALVGASYDNGPAALVFHDDPYLSTGPHTLPNGGTGSRTVYAAFGLESLSNDYYSSDAPSPDQTSTPGIIPDFYIPDVIPRNTRAAVMHNIVSYLRTGSVTGKITQTAAGNGQNVGDGVPNATVYLKSVTGQAPSTRPVFSATTVASGSGQGTFLILGVEPGTYSLFVYKNGYTRALSNNNITLTVEGDTTATESLTINPIPPGSIKGLVKAVGGNPVAGATVTFTSQDNTVTLSTQTFLGTQANQPAGQFLLSNVPVTTYTTAIANGPLNDQGLPQYTAAPAPDAPYAAGVPVQSSVTTGDGTTAGGPPVTFTLAPMGAEVKGRVYSGTNDNAGGALAAGSAVQAFANQADADSPTGTVLATATADANGNYDLKGILPLAGFPGTATQIIIKASGPGFTPVTFALPLYLGDIVTGKDVALIPIAPGTISGTVTYTDGTVAANAVVTFAPPGGAGAFSVTTIANGTYTTPAPSGTYAATAVGPPNPHGKPTAAATTATTVTVSPGQTTQAPFVLTLIAPSFSGTVVDAAKGTPLQNALITVSDAATGTILGTTKTTATGAFTTVGTVALANGGTYTIVASLASYQSVTALDPFTPGSQNTKITFYNGDTVVNQAFRLNQLAPGTVNGKVTDNTSAVVVGATVTFTSTDGTISVNATTDSNGNYAFPVNGVPAGSYTATATGPLNTSGKQGYTSPPAQIVTITPSSPAVVNFTLTQIAPTVTVTVTDATANVPLTGATVTFMPTAGGAPTRVTANTAGVYTSPGLAPGDYTVTASAPGYFDSSATLTLELGDARTLALALSQKATVYGLATDSVSGAALSGVTLTVTDVATGLGVTTSPVAVTTGTATAPGPDGALQNYLLNLTPGRFVITANKPGYTQLLSAPFTVTNAVPVRVNLALTSSVGTLYGIVSDAANGSQAPVGGATVTVTNAAGTAVVASFTTSSAATTGVALTDGKALNYTGQLTAGTYSVSVTKGTRKSAAQTVVIKGGQSTRLDFTGAQFGLPSLYTFPAGLQFFSTPYDYSGLGFDGLLGTINSAAGGSDPNGTRSHIAVWSPLASTYLLDPTAPADTVRLGQGYWVFLKNPQPVTQQGAAPAGPFVAQPLNPTWNMIGVPNPNGVPIANLRFNDGRGGMITYAQASSSLYAILTPGVTNIYRYEPTNNTYQPVSDGGVLQPWQAYWIRVRVPATLEIPTAPTATTVTTPPTATGLPVVPITGG